MAYLNIDTKKGILALGGAPYKASGPEEGGSAKIEFWAQDIEPVHEHGTYRGVEDVEPIDPADDFEMVEVGHAILRPACKRGVPLRDSVLFEPDTLEAFKVWNADPPITIIKDGEVVATNVENYDSRLLHRPMVQAGLVVGGVIATGFVGKWLDWW